MIKRSCMADRSLYRRPTPPAWLNEGRMQAERRRARRVQVHPPRRGNPIFAPRNDPPPVRLDLNKTMRGAVFAPPSRDHFRPVDGAHWIAFLRRDLAEFSNPIVPDREALQIR